MPFLGTLAQMIAEGYRRSSYTKCRGCSRPMEWWLTPNKKRIPMDPMDLPDSPAISHFATCPESSRFKKEPSSCPSLISTSPDSHYFHSSLFSSPESDSSSTASDDANSGDDTNVD